MRLKIMTKIGTKFVYSQACIESWELEHILNYISNIQDIKDYYDLCRARSFILDGYNVNRIDDNSGKVTNVKSRVFTDFCTIVYMDRNVNYKTHSPFTLFVNGKIERILPGYHSTEYEKEIELARNSLLM